MAENIELPLVNSGFDRDARTRIDDSALDAAWQDPDAVLLRIGDAAKLPIRLSAGVPHLDFLRVSGVRTPEHFYLGRMNGAPVFCSRTDDIGAHPEPVDGWRHPFSIGSELSPLELEVMTVALAITGWNNSMPFSARDGSRTSIAQGGWARLDAHGGEHFPRTDPAVIVLVEHEDRLLLGSNVLWETGRFSLLAGFVEAGESAEQAVVREVQEESGVPVEDVRYVASQPWPFPRSLMLGFRAKLAAGADPEALHPDPTEISELRWFTRQQLASPAPELLLPRKLSIARWLIDLWVSEGDRER